jgi:GT2 family glycosyltransferase
VFVAFDRDVRVCLGVVTLGTPDRLRGCLDALRTHESRHDFTVAVVVNADTPDGAPRDVDAPEGVLVDPVRVNLGWSGGLHRARSLTDAELFVWVQDDMVPEPGWLDALVDAADAHPGVGGFGAVRVDEDGRVVLHNAGRAEPADAVERWNDSDTTAETLPTAVTTYDWVTSKGFLTRTAVFDEVGGPDPRLWPLNHVDKEYCTHLRCHGYDVALVPDARLRHGGSESAPTAFRAFLAHWREPWVNQRWAAPVAALAGHSSAVIDHPCADWRSVLLDQVANVGGAEASRMLVPMTRADAAATAELRTHAANLEHALAEKTAHAANLEAMLAEATTHAGNLEPMLAESAKHATNLEQALAAATAERDRARRRARRLRRRVHRLESSATWRLTRPLRALRRRLR